MTKIKILIIEDIPTDAELACREIDKELGRCEYRIVETETDFLETLENFGPELIISDYMLPQFNGMAALRLAVEKRPAIPFLIFTGSMNEDTAVECMKAGAWDYVIKEHIKRLGPAVRAALEEKKVRLERKETEEALWRAGKEWRATFDAMTDAVFVTDMRGVVLRANEAFRRVTGKRWSKIIGTSCRELLYESENENKTSCPLLRSLQKKTREESELRLGDIWYRSIVDPIPDENGGIIEVVHILTDITERKEAERALSDREAELKTIFESAPFALLIVDAELRVREINSAGLKLSGEKLENTPDQRLGTALRCVTAFETPAGCGSGGSCSDCMFRNIVLDTFTTGEEYKSVETGLVLNGPEGTAEKTVLLHTTPITVAEEELVLLILDDITEQKKAREFITKQKRLQAIGQIASGIAHDINNTLVPTTLYVEALLDSEPDLSERARRYITTIKTSMGDIEHVVSRLRAFYKKEETNEKEQIDIRELFAEVVDLSRPKWKDILNKQGVSVGLTTDVEDGLPSLFGNKSELRETLVNLIFNAVDALPEGGTVVLRAFTQEGRIAVEVTDTGKGMTEEERTRCIEPFYTTKGAAGTGLGLSSVFGMVQRHNGELTIESSPGEGTTVRLSFPVRSEPAHNPPVAEKARTVPSLRVLLIDDDKRVLEVLEEMLVLDGHEVLTCISGEDGVLRCKDETTAGRNIDLVLTDLGMPGMDGSETAAMIKRLSPETPVVLLTGWGSMLREEEKPEHIDYLLSKPPTMKTLREAIRRTVAPNAGDSEE